MTTLLLKSVISERGIILDEGGKCTREERYLVRQEWAHFSCLEGSYSSEALDSFGWRSAVFFCFFSRLLPFDFSMLSVGVSFFFLASMEPTCILLCSFFGFFFLMSNFVNRLFLSFLLHGPYSCTFTLHPTNCTSTYLHIYHFMIKNILRIIIISVTHKRKLPTVDVLFKKILASVMLCLTEALLL